MDKIEGRASFSLQARGPNKPYRILGFQQHQAMLFLNRCENPVSLATLARELDLYDKARASKLVMTLEKRGLVIRYRNCGSQEPTVAIAQHTPPAASK